MKLIIKWGHWYDDVLSDTGTYVGPAAAWSPTLKKIAETIDFAVAWYLDTHVPSTLEQIMGGYRFLMDNYRKGDRICIFGFSRGAYTARCLAGMLHKVGLLPKSNEEQVSFAYAKYIDTTPKGRIRAAGFKAAFSTPVDIEFMGVWDTVSSVGIKGRHLPFTSSNTIIRTFRHALSLDERRAKFQPNPWHNPTNTKEAAKNDPECGTAVYDEKGLTRLETAQKWFEDVLGGGTTTNGKVKGKKVKTAAEIPQQSQGPGGARPMADEDDVEDVYWNGKETSVKEVWFSGCHTDVGGGSVKNDTTNRLANISLCWMLNEIVKADANILFKEGAFSDVSAFKIICPPTIVLPTPPLTAGITSASEHRQREISEVTFVESPTQDGSPMRKAELSSHRKDLTTASIGNATIVSVQEEAMVKDSTAGLNDALAKFSKWWILELLPQRHAWQETDGNWNKGW
ncbi:hypothetical protein FRC00_006176 [Tulasnella sp. 408]|nr:hypothetical protein FRC00_006176 [Tulasnella sp. 408]